MTALHASLSSSKRVIEMCTLFMRSLVYYILSVNRTAMIWGNLGAHALKTF